MNPMQNTVADEPIDRDIPDLKTTKKKTNITRLVLVGGLLFALVLAALGITLFMKQLEKNKRQEVAEKAKERPKAVAATTADFDGAQARIRREKAQEEDAERAAEAAAAAAAAQGKLATPASAIGVAKDGAQGAAVGSGAAGAGRTGGAPSGSGAGRAAGGGSPVQTLAQRRMDGDVLVQTGGGGSAFGDDGGRRPAAPGGTAPVRLASADAPRNGLDDKVKPSVLQAGVAGQRPDLSMLLHRGTAIACGTITRIVSEHSGAVSCVVAEDVYSSDGKVLLIERGSKAFGERRDVMMQGQARIAAIWSRIDTPYGVFVDVNSLATDPLGGAGIPADVDNHLGQRFGGAILLSLIGDLGQAMANRASDSKGTVQFGNTSTAGQDLASKTLEHTINIPPTGYVSHGEATTIFVLRDMDFRRVYELARK